VKTYTITLSNKQKYVWFQIAKAGSRTVVNFLHENSDIEFGFPLRTKKNPGYGRKYKQKWDDHFKFTIVRNPWERLLSFYLNKLHTHLDPLITSHIQGIPSFKKFVHTLWRSNLKTCDVHFRLQTRCFPLDKIDFIGKTENLQEDFNTICDKIGIPKQELPHKNKSSHKHYTEYYDDETRQIVAEAYAKDIEYFGYEFGK
jgi:hypothetical protein